MLANQCYGWVGGRGRLSDKGRVPLRPLQHSVNCGAFSTKLGDSEQADPSCTAKTVSRLSTCDADPVDGMPTSWGTKIRTGGLAVILLRAGLKIDKLAFARAGKVVLRLALIPMLCEALVDGGCYYWSVTFHLACALFPNMNIARCPYFQMCRCMCRCHARRITYL